MNDGAYYLDCMDLDSWDLKPKQHHNQDVLIIEFFKDEKSFKDQSDTDKRLLDNINKATRLYKWRVKHIKLLYSFFNPTHFSTFTTHAIRAHKPSLVWIIGKYDNNFALSESCLIEIQTESLKELVRDGIKKKKLFQQLSDALQKLRIHTA